LEDQTAFRTIKIHFQDQKSVDDFAALVGQKLTEQTRFIWFPEAERAVLIDKRYAES
jgi:hypothetical protein